MGQIISKEKLGHYFSVTKAALGQAEAALNQEEKSKAEDFLDMASRYYQDALFFAENGDLVNAFAAVNYAHGWLDAGARIGLFKVTDSKLFTVDED